MPRFASPTFDRELKTDRNHLMLQIAGLKRIKILDLLVKHKIVDPNRQDYCRTQIQPDLGPIVNCFS